MATNQRSILLQRAMRAEQERKIAEDEAARAREALHEAHAAIRRLQHAAALAAELTPCASAPASGTRVQLVKVREAVFAHGSWQCPHTGRIMLPDIGMYWRELENEQ